jgi:hypothetical protein
MKIIIALALVAATPASAAVVSAAPNGFEIKQTVNLVVPPEVAMASFAELPSWWDPEHTYSGNPANMSLVLHPGGCFCERLPDGGGIEHMRVTFVDPGKRVVLTGSLGPLLYEATSGVMDIQVKRAAGGSQLILDYKVAGFANGGGEAMAAKVDEVLAEQMKRLRAYATSRPTTG